MSEPTGQTQRAYRPEMSRLWWLHRRSYVFFVLRELSSIFVAWSVVFLLLLVRALAQGEAQLGDFLDWAASPWVVALDVVTLAFLVLHAVTWFNLTPAATVVKLRGQRVPPTAIAGGAYAAWVAVTALVVVLVVTR
jgi:succinate dehydrogenase subunit C